MYATLGQQLKFVQHEDVNTVFNSEPASDLRQFHDNNTREQDWKHKQNDFVQLVHLVFMNHFGMGCL